MVGSLVRKLSYVMLAAGGFGVVIAFVAIADLYVERRSLSYAEKNVASIFRLEADVIMPNVEAVLNGMDASDKSAIKKITNRCYEERGHCHTSFSSSLEVSKRKALHHMIMWGVCAASFVVVLLCGTVAYRRAS